MTASIHAFMHMPMPDLDRFGKKIQTETCFSRSSLCCASDLSLFSIIMMWADFLAHASMTSLNYPHIISSIIF